MCGIVGVLGGQPVQPAVVEKMRDCLRHRGPDHAGLWQSPDGAVCLGHRRLAIIDLAPEANQPFVTGDGRFVIVFNGEIYNYRSLRADLERSGVRFRTRSDTEVLVEAWRRWGSGCFERLSGMFAFGLWDQQRRELICARDRAGEKPLYYALVGDTFVFGSELKALVAWPGFPRKLHGPAVVDFFSFGFVADPKTIWEGCFKLPPACWMKVSLPPAAAASVSRVVPYWDFTFAPEHGRADWGEAIRSSLRAAADEMAVSDVALGTFLSGGVDSSAVTAALSRAGHRVRSFTIGFDEAGYDERPWARRVAERYHTDHHERAIAVDDVDVVLDGLFWQYDEPFADYSYLPTFYLCREARRSITVALSGDGGDEVFAGYGRYQRIGLRTAMERVVPRWAVRLAATTGAHAVPGRRRRRALRQYAADPAGMYTDMLTLGLSLPALAAAARGPLAAALRDYRPDDLVMTLLRQAPPHQIGLVNSMRYLDLKLTLGSGILVKVDRASMAVSLEVRPVFLHRDLLALAGRIPPEALVGTHRAKHALKCALEPWLPADLLHRPKMGFALPLPGWLRRPGTAALFAVRRDSPAAEFIDPDLFERLRLQHTSGAADHTATLHNLGFFSQWLLRWA
jgi:asparagine synthase (glutamine-hydrolysing)